jgi:hypothetical protein
VHVRLGASGDDVTVRVRSPRRVAAGEHVGLEIDASQLRWFGSPRQKEVPC